MPGSKTTECRSCGAEIIWIETEAGKAHPIDVKPEKRWIWSPTTKSWSMCDTFMSHFGTCLQSKQWSKKQNSDWL